MFSDSRFQTVTEMDKYGRKIDKDNFKSDLDKFYDKNINFPSSKEQDDSITAIKKQKGKKEIKIEKKVLEKDEKFHWSEESSEEDEPLDEKTLKKLLGEKSDKEEQDEDDTDFEDEEDKIPTFDGSTSKLALMNMDWDVIGSEEIYVLLNSFLPSGGLIKKVEVYPSEFGQKQLKYEEKYGPNITINKTEGIERDDEHNNRKEKNIKKKNNSDDGDGDEFESENEMDPTVIRKYEKSKQKYYYAVISFDSQRTANHIYKNCDGTEFMLSGLILDLRYMPEQLVLPYKPRDVCNSFPEKNLESIKDFISRVDSHTKVDFTWEEADNTRYQHQYNLEDDDLDKVNLDKYLGSDTEDDEDDNESDSDEETSAQQEMKRNLQLQSLKSSKNDRRGETQRGSDNYRDYSKNFKNNDIMITFKGGLEEEEPENNMNNNKKSTWNQYKEDKKRIGKDLNFKNKNDQQVDSDDDDELLVSKNKKIQKNKKPVESLSKRQKEELELIADGKTDMKVNFFLFL